MPAAVLTLAALSLAPSAWTGWAEGAGELVRTAAAPIVHPMRLLAGWLRPAEQARDADEIERLRGAVDRLEFLWRRDQAEAQRLAEVVRDLQRGREFGVRDDVELAAFPVIGGSSDPTSGAMLVRAGERDGLTEGTTVATTRGTQLVGRVVRVGGSFSTLIPITDPGAGQLIDAVILTDETDRAERLRCQLYRAENGRLIGDAEVLSATADRPRPPTPTPGMAVRLLDSTWPPSAQMLVIGVIEEVRTEPDSLRPTVIVRPGVPIQRLSEVVLRIPVPSGEPAGGPGR